MTKNKTKIEILVIPKRKYTKKNDNKPTPEQTTNNKKGYDSDESNDNKKNVNRKQLIKKQSNPNKKNDKEIKIDNLIQSLNDDELIKLQAKNEKLKSKLMKMI